MNKIERVLQNTSLVVFQTRIVTPVRDTHEGKKEGSRIEKILQSCFNPKLLSTLNSMKQEASRLCRAYGTKVESLNAWAVPLDRKDELLAALAAIKQRWDGEAESLAASIGDNVREWSDENPAEREWIKSLAPNANDVRRATRFIYTCYQLPVQQIEDKGDCLKSDLLNLPVRVIAEIAQAMKDAGHHKTARFSHKARPAFERYFQKAGSMAFLDPRIKELADVLHDVLQLIPISVGTGSEVTAHRIREFVEALTNPWEVYRSGIPERIRNALKNASPLDSTVADAAPSASGVDVDVAMPASGMAAVQIPPVVPATAVSRMRF